MKANIAIAALLSAAAFLTPAHANTTLTATFSVSNGIGTACFNTGCTVSASATGYTDLFPASGAGSSPNFTNAKTTNVGVSGGDLELSGGPIVPTDGIVLDFAGIPQSYNGGAIQSIEVSLLDYNTGSYYEIYGNTGKTGNGTSAQLADGPTGGTQTNPNTASFTSTLAQADLYATNGSFIIGLSNNDCDLVITGLQVTYAGSPTQTPEPGTFLMGGMVLLGVGFAMKKRSRKA